MEVGCSMNWKEFVKGNDLKRVQEIATPNKIYRGANIILVQEEC